MRQNQNYTPQELETALHESVEHQAIQQKSSDPEVQRQYELVLRQELNLDFLNESAWQRFYNLVISSCENYASRTSFARKLAELLIIVHLSDVHLLTTKD